MRTYHECEGRIEKSVPRVTVWQHKACRMMTNGDPKGQNFLSYPHTNNEFFFLLTIKHYILCLKKLLEVPKYAEMRHDMMTSLYLNNDVT